MEGALSRAGGLGMQLQSFLPLWFGASEVSAAVLVILQLTLLRETLGGDVS